MGGIVNVLLHPVWRGSDPPEDSAGHATFQIGPVTDGPRSLEMNPAGGRGRIACTEFAQFVCQNRFEAARAGCKKPLVCAIPSGMCDHGMAYEIL